MTTQDNLGQAVTAAMQEQDKHINSSQEPEPKVTEQVGDTQEQKVQEFAEQGDLNNRSPEEMKAIYADWTKKYTQKRQAETAELKQAREEAETLRIERDELKKMRETQSAPLQSGAMQSAANKADADLVSGRLSVQEYTDRMRQIMSEDARRIFEEVYSEKSQEQQAKQFEESAAKDFITSDNRLDQNSPTYDKRMARVISADMDNSLTDYQEENGTFVGFDAKGTAKRLIQEYDNEMDEIIKTRVQSSSQIAKEKAGQMNRSGMNGRNTPSNGTKKTLEQILRETMGV